MINTEKISRSCDTGGNFSFNFQQRHFFTFSLTNFLFFTLTKVDNIILVLKESHAYKNIKILKSTYFLFLPF